MKLSIMFGFVTTDLEKSFAVVVSVADSSANGCDPDVDKTSTECVALVNTFKELVSNSGGTF